MPSSTPPFQLPLSKRYQALWSDDHVCNEITRWIFNRRRTFVLIPIRVYRDNYAKSWQLLPDSTPGINISAVVNYAVNPVTALLEFISDTTNFPPLHPPLVLSRATILLLLQRLIDTSLAAENRNFFLFFSSAAKNNEGFGIAKCGCGYY